MLAPATVFASSDTSHAHNPSTAESSDIDYASQELALLMLDSIPAVLPPARSGLATQVVIQRPGEPVVVNLRSNASLFAEDSNAIPSADLPYLGQVEGDSQSWARLSRRANGHYEGLIFFEGELHELRDDPHDSDRQRFGVLSAGDYLHGRSATPAQCGVEAPPEEHSTHTHARQETGCKTIDISLVSDYTHVEALGGEKASRREMIARINEVDGLYRSALNLGFRIRSVDSFASPETPNFNEASSNPTPLDELSEWKAKNQPDSGLTHLFVARIKQGTVGLAWVSTICRATYGAGVSNYLGSGRSSTIVVAHEIGHNFGASHDAHDADTVMAPAVVVKAVDFSASSKSSIAATVNKATCLVPCKDADDPSPDTIDSAGNSSNKNEDSNSSSPKGETDTSEDPSSPDTDYKNEDSTKIATNKDQPNGDANSSAPDLGSEGDLLRHQDEPNDPNTLPLDDPEFSCRISSPSSGFGGASTRLLGLALALGFFRRRRSNRS